VTRFVSVGAERVRAFGDHAPIMSGVALPDQRWFQCDVEIASCRRPGAAAQAKGMQAKGWQAVHW
jgi:hypothetical protein